MSNQDKRYSIIRELGRGNFGITYLVYDNNNKRYAAAKTLDVDRLIKGGQNIDDIIEEVNALKNLSAEPNCYKYIACYIEAFRENVDGIDTIVIVMEYINGLSLDKILNRSMSVGGLNYNRKLHIMKQLAVAIEYIHSKGYAHQDIKPENIMITLGTYDVKIIDFGLSCSKACRSGPGSAFWSPPEYYIKNPPNSLEASQAHDIWSLGIVYYQMVNGYLPFRDAYNLNFNQFTDILLSNDLLPSSSENQYLNRIIYKMLNPNWRNRPTASQVVDSLDIL